jgi:hypothetical protein
MARSPRMRLFYSMQTENGIYDANIEKVRAMFDRGKGMVLFATTNVWFSDAQRMTEILCFIDPGHRRSQNARELRKFAEQCRRVKLEIEHPPASDEPAKPDLALNGQKCAAPDAAQPVAPPNCSEKNAPASASNGDAAA